MHHIRILRASVPLLSLLTISAVSAKTGAQSPLMTDQNPTLQSSSVTLSDVLPRSQTIGIFTSLCNDIPNVSDALSSTFQNLTVLAPEDSAIKQLPRKPWEDPAEYDKLGENAYAGQDGVDRAQRNLRKFVEAHVVKEAPWREGEKVERLSGGQVWWEMKEGKKIIQPGNIEVVRIADKVSNGEVWVVAEVLNYAI